MTHVLVPLTRYEAERVVTDLLRIARHPTSGGTPARQAQNAARLRAVRNIRKAIDAPPGSTPRRGP